MTPAELEGYNDHGRGIRRDLYETSVAYRNGWQASRRAKELEDEGLTPRPDNPVDVVIAVTSAPAVTEAIRGVMDAAFPSNDDTAPEPPPKPPEPAPPAPTEPPSGQLNLFNL